MAKSDKLQRFCILWDVRYGECVFNSLEFSSKSRGPAEVIGESIITLMSRWHGQLEPELLFLEVKVDSNPILVEKLKGSASEWGGDVESPRFLELALTQLRAELEVTLSSTFNSLSAIIQCTASNFGGLLAIKSGNITRTQRLGFTCKTFSNAGTANESWELVYPYLRKEYKSWLNQMQEWLNDYYDRLMAKREALNKIIRSLSELQGPELVEIAKTTFTELEAHPKLREELVSQLFRVGQTIEGIEQATADGLRKLTQSEVFGKENPSISAFSNYLKKLREKKELSYSERQSIAKTANFWKRQLAVEFIYKGKVCNLRCRSSRSGIGDFQLREPGTERHVVSSVDFPPIRARQCKK